ncbi:MAG: 2-hydroxyglutaryl-CoA dehydratase [Nitrospinae bacterium]|nr:2-hydroxyglutaryl-CoA dehydratase [Nitrospinota bacterium]
MPEIYAGIDVGSLCTKVVILDAGRNVLSSHILRSGGHYQGAAEAAFSGALESAGLRIKEISFLVSTGYGRARVTFSDTHVTEITCHARGAKHLFPHVHTVIDIGGQDSKVIYVNDEGRPKNFVMNDKCAAGTGRFLEVMAGALEVSLQEMAELSFHAQGESEVSNMCTVFAESEVISLLAQGTEKADIAAAIFRSIARRITGLVGKLGLKEPVVMTGGVAKNPGMVRALEEKLRTTLLIPPEPQIMGAYGAALIAAEQSD